MIKILGIITFLYISDREVVPLSEIESVEVEIEIEIEFKLGNLLNFSQVARLESGIEKQGAVSHVTD